jgi:hypothetical protein
MAATYAAPALPGLHSGARRVSRSTQPGLRMTRRGRLVVLAVALLVVLLPGAWRR